MSKRAPLIGTDSEVREMAAEDVARLRPVHEVLPVGLERTLGMRRRGPQKVPTKVVTTIRLDADLLEALTSSGEGWQTHVNSLVGRELMGKALTLRRCLAGGFLETTLERRRCECGL